MSQLSHFLQAGVHVHPFSDRSGTVLFNEKTTQMLTLFFTQDKLNQVLSHYSQQIPLSADELSMVKSLIRQEFIYQEPLQQAS